MAERVAPSNLPLVYAHLVGGQDEVVFDGASFALDCRPVGRAPGSRRTFRRAVARRATAGEAHRSDHQRAQPRGRPVGALVLGVRDYIGKNGFPGVLLGLSGGIDSALVLAVASMRSGATRCGR